MSSADTDIEGSERQAPRDTVREDLLAKLQAELGEAVLGSQIEKGDIWVRVANESWSRAATVCRDVLGCDYFCFLSGLDWMPATAPNPEEAQGEALDEDADEESPAVEPDETPVEASDVDAGEGGGWRTGYAGGDTRFQVIARLYSTSARYGITLKADLDDENPTVESITSVYRGADWHEREAWEMFGFDFPGHPHLRHLYLPVEFEGHPLRKDFPLLAREVKPWPGLVDVEPMPGEEADAGGGDA